MKKVIAARIKVKPQAIAQFLVCAETMLQNTPNGVVA